jgi:hypothetical protein
MAAQVIGEQRFIIRRHVGPGRLLDRVLSAGRQIDAEPVREIEDVTPSPAVAFGELSDELLDAGRRHGDDPLLLTLPQRDLLAERAFEHRLEIRRK